MRGFIEANYKQIKISEKLRAKVDKHMYVTKTLLTHYEIDQKLDEPFIEYARYVLMNGTESEKTGLAAGMETTLQVRHGELEFYRQ